MKAEPAFHYPPDLLELLVDTVPLLCKGKEAVLTFFRGAGVPFDLTSDLHERVKRDRESISKYEIARRVLTRVNEKGEIAEFIKIRREILKRIVEWEDYSTCYPENQLKAKGAVAEVRRVVGVVDSFRRMKLERDAELRKHQEAKEAALLQIQQKKKDLETIKSDLNSLFGITNRQQRGKKLESVLGRLFAHSGILTREAFTLRTEEGKDLEQIDAVVDIGSILYLVEMKWWGDPVGVPEVSQHISRIFLRGNQARGLYIAYNGYTDSAIKTCKEAINAGAIIALCHLHEFVSLLEGGGDLKALLQKKIDAAVIEKNPLV